MKKLLAGSSSPSGKNQMELQLDQQPPTKMASPTSSSSFSLSLSSSGHLATTPLKSSTTAAPPSSPTTTGGKQPKTAAPLSSSGVIHLCLYCAEKVDIMSEQYCQLGGGARYWHTRCVESSRARRETTMMLMHSMNQLASTFIGQLSTGTTAPDDQDADDRSTSNTSDLDTTDCFSSATEGDYTIRSDRGGGGGGRGRKAVTVWDDSDVSDVDITLRGYNVVGSMRGSSSPSSKRRPPVVVTNSSSSPSPSPSPFETVRRGMAPWGASLRPHGTFYRSLSFELDSAGNTIRPKPKRQKDKDAKEKSRKDKHSRFSPHKNNNSSGTNHNNAGESGEGRLIAMSSSSAMLSPRRATQLQQLQQHPLSGSLSSLSSDDETLKDRPRMRKKTKGSSDKGNPNARSKCGTCAEVIAKDGNYVFVNGNKHHIDCFFCSSCLRPRFYELKDGKTVCVECLPQCDGCNLPLIPATGGKHGRPRTHSNGNSNHSGGSCAASPTAGDNGNSSGGLASVQHNKENINGNSPLFASGDEPREKIGGGGGVGGTTSAGQEDKEDGEAEMVIERDGVVQRFHRKCILKCPSCRLPIQRKHGKLYKKQGKPWCAKCISKCSVFEDKALVVVKPQAGSKSRSTSLQGAHHGPNTIEELLGEELGLHSFIDFMVHDYSVENILFYLDVEAFKRLKRKQDILSQANNIYNKYLTTEAELELASIDAEERKKLTYILANKTGKVKNNFFEALQKHIYSFLKENAFPRYLKSDECRALFKTSGVPPSSPGSSSPS